MYVARNHEKQDHIVIIISYSESKTSQTSITSHRHERIILLQLTDGYTVSSITVEHKDFSR